MSDDSKNCLVNIIKQYVNNTCDLTIRYNYSGRCMYGKTCLGIVGDFNDLKGLLKHVLHELNNQVMDCDNDDDMRSILYSNDEIIDMVMDYNMDSMGLDQIMYWKNIDVNDEELENYEEDEE